jgi:hypothetical protein
VPRSQRGGSPTAVVSVTINNNNCESNPVQQNGKHRTNDEKFGLEVATEHVKVGLHVNGALTFHQKQSSRVSGQSVQLSLTCFRARFAPFRTRQPVQQLLAEQVGVAVTLYVGTRDVPGSNLLT